MDNYNSKVFWYIGVTLGIIVYFLYTSTNSLDPLSIEALRIIPSIVLFELIFWWLFAKYIWKLKIFYPWLVYVPNISGSWFGTIVFKNSDNEETTKNVNVLIQQTLQSVHILMKSADMDSVSFVSGFLVDKENKQCRLAYSYTSKARINQRETNPIHDGSVLLTVNIDTQNHLDGEYWTSRKTSGEIRLTKQN